jgi:hypothetical protein
VLKFGHFGKYIRNAWKILKYDAGEKWISVGSNMYKMRMYYIKSRRRGISYLQ